MLLAALDRLGDDWRGYDVLTEGLARIVAGSPPAPHADPIEEEEIRGAAAERLNAS